MNKVLLMMLSISLFVLAGCSSDSELESKELGLSTFDPTLSSEEAESIEIKFTSSMPVFFFLNHLIK